MFNKKIKKVVFVPPNGKMFINDFSIQRIGHYLSKIEDVETVLCIVDESNNNESFDFIHRVIRASNQKQLLKRIKEENADVIFHRSWMLAYPFAAKLVKKFDNVIVNIKDWNFSSKKEYGIIFTEEATKDFKAMKYIMKHAELILSHYTQEQAKLWAKQYKVDQNKFIFFPEFCNENNFNFRKELRNISLRIAFAGSLGPTTYPEEFFLAKSHLRAVRFLTKKSIDVSYVLVEGSYAATQSPRQRLLFQDILYENQFNDKFHLVKGKQLDSSILNSYHFGFFILEYTTKNKTLNKYAVPSKFAFYLEAGMPMIINSKMKALSKIVEKYELGIVFKSLNDLIRKLENLSEEHYFTYVNNVENYRKNFTYEKNIDAVFN